MKKVLGIFLGLIAVLIIGIVGFSVLPKTIEDTAHDTGEGAKAAATNVVIEASGLKQKVADALEANREKIATATGMSLSQVDTMITDLDIESWEACALPKDAESTGSFNGAYAGITAEITTYKDPSYVTVEAEGQSATLAVPETAQTYLRFLQFL